MKKFTHIAFYISALFFGLLFNVNAQTIQWQKSYGGTLYESANSVIQTKDGGYIVLGLDSSCDGDCVRPCGGKNDLWVVKLSSLGVIEWQKSYGGSDDEEAYQIIQTKDGGYALAAITFSTDVPGFHQGASGTSDAWILKLDAQGVVKWQKAFGGAGLDEATSIAQTKDGGYIVGGNSQSTDGDVTGHHGLASPDSTAQDDVWVLKLDSAGNLKWQKSIGGLDDDGSNSIIQANDGGYVVVGNSKSIDGDLIGKGNKGYNDWMIVKLSSTGNIVWLKLYGGSAQDDAANSITKATDGGYVIAGGDGSVDGDVTGHHGPPCTDPECTDNDCWVIKIDSVGNLKWQKSLGGTGDDNTFSISNATDGGYVLAAYSLSNDGDATGNHGLYDFWIAKIDAAGNLKWQQSLGGAGIDQAYSMRQVSDGGYIVAGTSESTDGDVTGNHGNTDVWVVKLSPTTSVREESNSSSAINIFPNPTNGFFYVKSPISDIRSIEIYNLFGAKIYSSAVVRNPSSDLIDLSGEPKGIYFIRLISDNGNSTKKFIIQ